MECPHCKLLNPDTAQRCDCGYNFTTKTLEEPYDRSVPRKTINVLKIAAALVSLGISVLYARGPGNGSAGWFLVGPIFWCRCCDMAPKVSPGFGRTWEL